MPRSALSYEGQRSALTIHLELHKVPGGFGAKLTHSPSAPHLDLFATARPLWLLGPEALLLTGDLPFDAAVALRAPHELLGPFDHVHRRAFARLLASGDSIVEAGCHIATIDQRTHQELQVLVALGHRFCLGRAAGTTCLDLIARTDPHPAVREQARSLAGKPLATSLTTRSDLELEPSSAELRRTRDHALEDDGAPRPQGGPPLARRARPDARRRPVRGRARRARRHRREQPRAQKFIGPSLRPLLIERASKIARAQRRGVALLEVAASSVPPERPAQLLELVFLLGELGDPNSAPFLFTLVEHNDDDVREATLVALGRCGTVEHIDYLEPQTSGLFRSSRVKQLARDAIAAIRNRAGLRDVPGALSLSGDSAGGLSEPDT